MKSKSEKNRHFVYTVSLGCPKNFVDTEVIAGSMVVAGFGLTSDLDEADLYLLNTCAFLPSARAEAEEYLADASAWKAKAPKHRKIVVSGCLNQWDTDRIYPARYPQVDLWAGINDVAKLGERLAVLFQTPATPGLVEIPDYLYDETTPRLQLTPSHYAYIKISEGCDNRCSYCSIPKIRGRLRSRGCDSVVKEAENLLAGGVKELIVIGQDITAFGHDRGHAELSALLRRLDALPGDFRLRLLYTHPAHFTPELVDVFASGKHLLPYLDMPLQHIADRILKVMGRKVGRPEIEKLLRELRAKIPGLGLRTTFITGFPGETNAEFQELYDFVQAQRFERMGVFTYCPEPETAAARMADQVPQELAASRRDRLMELQAKLSLKFNQAQIGKVWQVMIDAPADSEGYLGRTYLDTPEIDNCVMVRTRSKLEPGAVIPVTITAADEYDLTGKPATTA